MYLQGSHATFFNLCTFPLIWHFYMLGVSLFLLLAITYYLNYKTAYPLTSILVITTWKKSPTRGHLFSVPGVNFVPGSDQRSNWSKGNTTRECG